MHEPRAAGPIDRNGLPQDGLRRGVWRILDTRFDRGLRFLSHWQAWKLAARRPCLLHYVALAERPISLKELLASSDQQPQLQALAKELSTQWHGLLPGFHRFTLDGAQVQLTLCLGDLPTMLRQQQFQADAILLDPEPADSDSIAPWNLWTIKALARCSRRGTVLIGASSAVELGAYLTQCGFERGLDDGRTAGHADPSCWHFNPRWTIRPRQQTTAWLGQPARCVVIGAGLAGASVASALALRGWQVRVLDQGAAPVSGASGLPVGLVATHASVDDCALSRLSRCGVRLMLQQASQNLRQGLDWENCGTLEIRPNGTLGLPTSWPESGHAWSCKATHHTPAWSWRQAQKQTTLVDLPAIWHEQAAWLKPAELVHAWLQQTGVSFQGHARAANIRPRGEEWEVLDASGQLLASGQRVVLANASGALPLLQTLERELPGLGFRVSQLPAMQAVAGQLSWARHSTTPAADFPPFPVHGAGSLIPNVPMEGGRAWFVGSSYQSATSPPVAEHEAHASNLGRLNSLIPALGQALVVPFACGAIHAWKSTRWVTSDRLPMVGPLYQGEQSGLWISAGMGSRGLSFSVLCAELLAAHWGAEPLPLEADLARSLVALRGAGSNHGQR